MTKWVLTDNATGEYVERLELSSAQLGAPDCRVVKHRRYGGRHDGVDVIGIFNGSLRFTVLPTRGMGLHQLWAGDYRIGWNSPIDGPIHPAWVNLADPSGLGWLDGFDEFLCRCGLESNGAPEFDDHGRVRYPLHGRIANLAAHHVELSVDKSTGDIVLTGSVDESRFLFRGLRLTTTIRTRPGENVIRIRDEVTNLAETPSSMELLYHINFGGDLLDAGSRVVAPVRELVPRNPRAAEGIATWDQYAAPQAGFAEQVYLMKLAADAAGQSSVLLKNAAGSLAAQVGFNTTQLPCFTLWKNTGAVSDGYVTGLEPGTNYPNVRSYEESQGRVVPLKPGETRAFDLSITLHQGTEPVASAERAVQSLAVQSLAAEPPTIHQTPQSGWVQGA